MAFYLDLGTWSLRESFSERALSYICGEGAEHEKNVFEKIVEDLQDYTCTMLTWKPIEPVFT